jgi:hypothetical protein
MLHDAGLGDEATRDHVIILTNYLIGAVMIDSSRARRRSSPKAFERGLHLLSKGLREDASGWEA